MKVETRRIDEIRVGERKRELREEKIQELMESIRDLGLLQPIGIDRDNNLVYGYHRLEGRRMMVEKVYKGIPKSYIPLFRDEYIPDYQIIEEPEDFFKEYF